MDTVTPVAIEDAARSLSRHLRPTPLQYSPAISARAGCEVHIKIESVLPGRSFKVRGALNRISRLEPRERAAGVITASAGNHGLGLAYAAAAFGIPAKVYVPNNANDLKVKAIERLGAQVVAAGSSYGEAYLESRRAQGEATFVHAYEDPDVVAGQGTIGLELLADLPELDTVLVPVGGGGLIAGIAVYLKSRRPEIKVIGVEPAGANALRRSLEAGRRITLPAVDTIADGLAASQPGDFAFAIAQRSLDTVLEVQEAEMVEAIRLYFEWEHLLAEPAGAAALASLLHHYRPAPRERVVVVLSGANVTREVMLSALSGR